MNKIKEIFNWYDKFNNENIVIKTKNNEFDLSLSSKGLPHLLGLHYISKNNKLRGYRLYNQVKNKTDEEIFSLIKEKNPDKLFNVKERIENFKYFMENLEKATLYEQSNENSKIKSEFLMVKVEENKYLHLGVARDREYEDYLETFIVRKDDEYFKKSNIKEPVLSIEKYVGNKLVPFSFNEIKNEMLKDIEYGLSDELNNKLIEEVDFEKLPSFYFENFKFYPVKDLTEEENSTLLTYANYDNLNYDFLIRDKNISNLEYFKDKLNKNANDILEAFYREVPDEFKNYELFYCNETRNLYIPSFNGLRKYTKYKDESLLKELTNSFSNLEKFKEQKSEINKELFSHIRNLVIDYVNQTYDKKLNLKDFEFLCKNVEKVKLLDENINKHHIVYELDLNKYKSTVFVDGKDVSIKTFNVNGSPNGVKTEIERDLNSLREEFNKFKNQNTDIIINGISVNEYINKNYKTNSILDLDTDNDGIIGRFDVNDMDNSIKTISDIEIREEKGKRR